MFNSSDMKVDFQQSVFGYWGRFSTPPGTVEFLETKARIGTAAKDREKRLTAYLRPVREVLPTQAMDFNQLLQRDLDDHRVATELVPYILNPSRFGPAFFPPIVAAVLPFDGSIPQPRFETPVDIIAEKDGIATWNGRRYGSAFKTERMQGQAPGSDSEIKLGRLSWNPEEVKLVVIDGQHRAMALLAIDRTINNGWSDSGEKYKFFYEPEIQRALRGKTQEQRRELFEHLEFPVTLVWFPDSNDEGGDHHVAARKLFVDVNKNARKPTESRILLLSDTELLGIFTRRVLNEFRQGSVSDLPIYAIEYDNPERDQASAAKWSVISNVMIVRDCLRRTIFGPQKYIRELDSSFGGRESDQEKAEFMRRTLQIDEQVEHVVDGIERSAISDTLFPRSKVEFLQDQVMRGWGAFIVRVLSEVLPFKAHGEALAKLKSEWVTAGSTDTLAKDAVFEGVGMFWTIRDSHRHWQAQNQERRELKQSALDKTDIVRTWDAIEAKKTEFTQLRARLYLGRDDSAREAAVNSAFETFGTNACQLGLALAARTLALRIDVKLDAMPAFVSALVEGVNASLAGGPKSEHGRRLVLGKNQTDPLNRIAKLDTPFAMHFRYFWLEILSAPEARDHLLKVMPEELLIKARDEARWFYRDFLVKEMERAIRRTERDVSPKELTRRSEEDADESLRKALSRWFGVKKADYQAWRDAGQDTKMHKGVPTVEAADVVSDDDEAQLAEEEEGEKGPVSFEDLLVDEAEDE
ncbi:hypothetical protein MRF4_21610 [Methylobacterium radiotolerans]|uniref:DNA sulfur modification protein DndB n=1 Tax=Methylobacterium TaxID=407 RepID=UPI002F2E22A3